MQIICSVGVTITLSDDEDAGKKTAISIRDIIKWNYITQAHQGNKILAITDRENEFLSGDFANRSVGRLQVK